MEANLADPTEGVSGDVIGNAVIEVLQIGATYMSLVESFCF